MRSLLFVPIVLTAMAGTARADLISISGSGTWAADATTTGLSAPDESWTLTFDVDSPIPVTNLDVGDGQSVPIIDAVYTLDGSQVGTATDVRFFASGFGGLFTVDFSGVGSPFDLDFYGPQVVDGTTGQLIAGTYSGVSDVGVTHDPAGEGAASFTISPVPEPTSLVDCVTAVGLLGFVWQLRRRAGRSGSSHA